ILNVTAAEAHEIIFGEYRPVRREHPFAAAAERPTLTAGRKVADLRAGEVEYGRVGTGPGRAALRVNQDGRLQEKAFARGQRIEPVGAAVDAAVRKVRPRAQIGRVDDVANAKAPLIELDIAADLAAAGYAGRVGGERSA